MTLHAQTHRAAIAREVLPEVIRWACASNDQQWPKGEIPKAGERIAEFAYAIADAMIKRE